MKTPKWIADMENAPSNEEQDGGSEPQMEQNQKDDTAVKVEVDAEVDEDVDEDALAVNQNKRVRRKPKHLEEFEKNYSDPSTDEESSDEDLSSSDGDSSDSEWEPEDDVAKPRRSYESQNRRPGGAPASKVKKASSPPKVGGIKREASNPIKREETTDDSFSADKMSAVEPIARGSEYRCIADFETALVEWETKHGHEFRVGSSENLKNKYGMKDEVFEYRVLVLQCVHYGNPRDRANNKRKRNSCAGLPCGCSAMLRLNFSVKEQLLRITSLIDVHTGHELKPGNPDSRNRFSEKRRSVKRARMSDMGGSPASPAVVQDLDFGIKPKIPFPLICALAIHNSSEGKLLTKDIYNFCETQFPFFRTAFGSWKNSVRHALHTHMYFEKAMGPNKDKENLMFSITHFEKFQKDLEAFVERFPDRTKSIYGLSNPDHWDLMVKGELTNKTVAIHRPKVVYPKKAVKKEMTEEEDEMEAFVIIDAPETKPQVPMAPFLPNPAMNMQMPSFQAPQYPLAYPVQPSPAFNYDDVRHL